MCSSIKSDIQKGDKFKGKNIVMMWETFSWHGLGPLVLLLNDHIYPMMKSSLFSFFLGCLSPIHWAWRITEWFDEYENVVNHML